MVLISAWQYAKLLESIDFIIVYVEIISSFSVIKQKKNVGRRLGTLRKKVMSKRIITLLSKQYCGLCEDAEFKLLELKKQFNFQINKVDVEEPKNKQFLKKYYFDIPVVLINEKEFKSRINWELLTETIKDDDLYIGLK